MYIDARKMIFFKNNFTYGILSCKTMEAIKIYELGFLIVRNTSGVEVLNG